MTFQVYARGRTRLPAGTMNKTEERYSNELQLRYRAGEIAWWKFEGLKLRLADNTFYTPDFVVMLNDGQIEFHETKGHWEDDAKVKVKVAAEMYPFKFIAIRELPKKEGGGWEVENF